MTTRLVCFDLDGTLIAGTTSMLFMSERLGFLDRVREYERQYSAGLMTNIEAANLTAKEFTGISLQDIELFVKDAPKINNIPETIAALKQRGIILILASITWSFTVECFAKIYGFSACCGTGMKMHNGRLTGEVTNYCSEQDKLKFFLDSCRNFNIDLEDTVAIGDSRSDHPIFRKAGYSIALNADNVTKKIATCSLDTDDLLDVLPLIK
jgi:phosphoserine phosphatase